MVMQMKTVWEIATKEVVVAEPNWTVEQLIEVIYANGFRRLPIVEKTVLQGIVTISDLLKVFGNPEYTVQELLKIKAKNFMSTNVVSIHPEASIGHAAQTMLDRDISSLLLIYEENGAVKLAGIVTARDIVIALHRQLGEWEEDRTAIELASPKKITSDPSITIRDAAQLMGEGGFRQLALTTEQETLEGLVTGTDIVYYLAKKEQQQRISRGEDPLSDKVGTIAKKAEDLVFVDSDTPFSDVLIAMEKYSHGTLPVVKDGRLLGLVTEHDLLKVAKEHFK